MVTSFGSAAVICLIFLYPIFYATLLNVKGAEQGYTEENKQKLYRCTLDTPVKKPSLNLKVDLENMEMTWDSNITVTLCSVDTFPNNCKYATPSKNKCHFESVRLHKGATFIAKMKYMNQSLQESIYFPPEEMDGTAAENFSCVLSNVSFLSCTWNAGRNAPEDVQYFLYQKYSKNHGEQKTECPHYIKNAFGRHIACHIPKISIDQVNNIYYFKVNGSSNKSQIRYYDERLTLCSHEKLGAPQNIITNCSEPLLKCRIQWTPPQNNYNCGIPSYEIKDETENTTYYESSNYKDITVKEKHILQIRMRKTVNVPRTHLYGDWSEQIILDLPPKPIPPSIITLICVALGTILLILSLVFVCKRYHIWHKLTNPVPQPKNLFQQYSKNTEKEWVDSLPAAHEPDEKITFIEEVTDSFKK
ncbi:granulocyte-macrophage colony-stimulating factor receptor subunit alpha-like [Eublepharis macularius]|uniref:Granulocyte-macrophage colony-stimulating factor receptor subunit alpha-like n=1 Tax=Eublepharis macularius TaxID=481883 RepID=A0AA97KTH6_EUBMA|nr:granulocyte-macrophage colony-stimulating factor receptor subunit alpha-like [Eublepharis macularius]